MSFELIPKARPVYIVALLLVFAGLWWWKSSSMRKTGEDVMVLEGTPIPRKPIISVINEMFGQGIDSVKACDCFIPRMYEIIKKDSVQLVRLKNGYLPTHDDRFIENFYPALEECLVINIVDSNYKLQLKGAFLEGIKNGLKHKMNSEPLYSSYNIDMLADCFITKVNNRITVAEFFGTGIEKEKAAGIFAQCFGETPKK